jgi:hypothetical protein
MDLFGRQKPILKVVHEFIGSTSKEITRVNKGDRLELLDDSFINWYEVKVLKKEQFGLIPREFVEFEGSLESEE